MTNPNVQDKQIKTLKQLKELTVADGGLDCYILLNGGLRSSKNIRYSPDDHRFYVLNLIDDSEQELTEDQIFDRVYTHIGEAMKKNALIID